MFKRIRTSVIRDNRGDAYIMFLFVLIIALLTFSAVFGLMKVRVYLRDVYTEIENSADTVISEIKEDSYQTLKRGTSDESFSEMTNEQLKERLCGLLEGTVEGGNIIKKNDDIIVYSIENITLKYENGNMSIGFDIIVPVRVNGKTAYTAKESYYKTTNLNFK